MANPLHKKKYKLSAIVFVVFFLACACVIFLESYIYQKQKSATAFAAKQQLTVIAELKVIHRHLSPLWSESKLQQGAAFYFSLPIRG